MDFLKDKLDQLDEFFSKKGLVFPLFRDHGAPSVSFTLLIVSYLLWVAGLLELIKGMDMSQAENMVWGMSALYFSRKLTKNDKNKLQIDPSTVDNKENQ